MIRLSSQPAFRRLALHSAVVVGLVFAAYLFMIAAGQKGSLAFDVVAYWGFNIDDLYRGAVGDLGFFAYSPAIALLLTPFTQLPWLAFVGGWYALLLGALAWLGRRQVLILLAFPPVAIDLYHGNIHVLLAAAIVAGFRYPAAWSFVVLTKITPGIGLLWFAARREWRALGVALGATALVALVSAAFLPAQWLAWLAMLLDSAGTQPPWPALPVPLWLRLPAAGALIWWGARRDARWVVPVGAALAVPALWPGAFAILAACWPLRRAAGRTPAQGAFGAASGGYHAPDAIEQPGAGARPAPA